MTEVRVGMRELKTQFSRYLQQVKGGAACIVTKREKAMACLSPVSPESKDRMQELIEAGLIAWNGQRLNATMPPAQIQGEQTVADLLLESRE